MLSCVSSALGTKEEATDAAWRAERVPGHFQDWILAGPGLQYTLVYAEPPPAYSLEDYLPC